MWGELTSDWGELSSECGASCLGRVFFGASCLGASCLWGELSVIPFEYLFLCVELYHLKLRST